MKVKYATQVFSRTVATNMGYLAEKEIIPKECEETADVLLFFDNLFDSINGSFENYTKRRGKTLLGPVTPKSEHSKVWSQAKKVLRTMKFVTKEGKEAGGGRPNNIVYNNIESALSGHSDSQESSARLINFHHEPTNDSENVQITSIVIEPPATDPPAIEPVPGTSSETTEPPATDPPAMEPVPGTSSENTQIYLGGVELNRVTEFKYLGHVVTETLVDDLDMERERRALAVRSNMLARRFARCTRQVKLTLFRAYCQSFYTCSLWVNYTRRAYSALRVQYNNALRIVLGLPRFCSASGMFAEARVDDFFAVMRKRAASLLSTYAEQLECYPQCVGG
ncbi:unnamed protein product [Plutella xylostella]|uniref:(diamondback moth) hypothetical protein n=1 Tax=Plutella xylostella TaxID=51655 RepID=A0A8S4FQB9_PLUXY|nr:unnamed protein product [Plutella xylostella]